MNKDTECQKRADLVPLEVIRVETALSRYPVHRLAKMGTIDIELREANERGETVLQWEVSYNSKWGQPGPLAYKLDTLVINRKIEEALRPVPKLIKLGSLATIARELGASTHNTTPSIKKALHQNASTYIVAKIRYKANDGTERTLEAGFTRYTVTFTGETLPDGRIADAVYLVLSDIYMQVLNGAMTRPLDYDYLRELPPAAQRWYELASYAMYAALKNGRSTAKLSYAEFCRHAPQTRYLDFEQVKKQMHKVHAPHRKSEYLAGVEFEATTDRRGQPDWVMIYTPGPKARAEFAMFGRRVERVAAAEPVAGPEPEPEPEPEPGDLERELIARGVTAATARELVATCPEPRIRAQIERVDWLRRKRPRRIADPGAYLAEAIRHDYAPPAGFAAASRPAEPPPPNQVALANQALARDRALRAQVEAYWASLAPEAQAQLDADALSDPAHCAALTTLPPRLRDPYLKTLRSEYICARLGLDPAN